MFMKIFKIVLISFFLITSANSNSIYNIIKIPNLKTYDLKSKNGVKYLTTKKSFQIGAKNNISCEKLDKENLDSKFTLIKNNLDLYNQEFLKKINLRFVVLCQNLFISKIILFDVGFEINNSILS